MVVSGGAVSPENRSNEDEAMRAEAERWLQLCGCCDAGIIGASCVCPPGDPRNVIGWALQRLAAVERERDQLRSANHAAVRLIREHGDVEVERDAALARIAAVEALHFARGRNILGKPVCAECSPLQPMPCPTLRALAAPTGPETPSTRWMPAPDTTWVNGVPSDVIQVGPGGADPKETRE